VAADDAMV